MLIKNKVAALVEHMPDKFSVDDLVGRVLLLQKIEQAQKEIETGEGIDWERVYQRTIHELIFP